jgi:hypothetical protein
MAPSSQNLGFLPVLGSVDGFSRSSTASGYHYSLFSTSDLDEPASGDVSVVVCMKSEEAQ